MEKSSNGSGFGLLKTVHGACTGRIYMNVTSYVELILISIFVCLIVFYLQQKNDTRFFKKRVFNTIIILTVVILVLDLLTVLMRNEAIKHSVNFHMLILCLYYALMCYLPMVIAKYCVKVSGIRFGHLGNALMFIPTLFSLVLIVINIFNPFLFRLGVDICYDKLSLYPLVYIAPLFYLFFALIAALVLFMHGSSRDRDILKHIIIFVSVGGVAIIPALVFEYFSFWPVVAVDIGYLYMTVQSKNSHDNSIVAFVDSLTGVKNAAAYRTALFRIDDMIHEGSAKFAVVVMDISGLKNVNDEYGHSVGDNLIICAARFICSVFAHSPVYRIGGDEFVAILENTDFENRRTLIEAFHEGAKCLNIYSDEAAIPVTIAIGMAKYKHEKEMRYADVFKLADRRMYEHKKQQKALD